MNPCLSSVCQEAASQQIKSESLDLPGGSDYDFFLVVHTFTQDVLFYTSGVRRRADWEPWLGKMPKKSTGGRGGCF